MSGVTDRAPLGGKGLVIRSGECKGESMRWCVYVNGSLSKQVWQMYRKLKKKVLYFVLWEHQLLLILVKKYTMYFSGKACWFRVKCDVLFKDF